VFAASLAKLRLATLDLVYVHNPAEVQLQALGHKGFLQALRNAFAELEVLRQEGKIRGYGLATWDCFRQPSDGPVVRKVWRKSVTGCVTGCASGVMPLALRFVIKAEGMEHLTNMLVGCGMEQVHKICFCGWCCCLL
jgi:hypothetical protein